MKPETVQLTVNDRIAIGKAASFLRFQAAYSVDATESARQEWRSTAESLTDIDRRCQPQSAEDHGKCVEITDPHIALMEAEHDDRMPRPVIQDVTIVRPGIDQVIWDKSCRRRDLPKVEQAEQWPKYYKPSQPRKTGYGKYVAYYKCSETEKGETVHTDGTSFSFTVRAPGLDWTEITEAEAMLLLDKLTEPQPQPQKTRVRLWLEGATKMVMCRNKAPYGDWQEIHHDSEGFYVEKHP